MLVGLSPSRLAIGNTMLASVVAGGLGVLVAPLIALDAQTLAFQIVPALAAALLAGFTSFFIACFAGLAIGVVQSLLIYWGTQSWFPTDEGGAPIRGLPELFVFLVVVLALFLRGASLRTGRAHREEASCRLGRKGCSGGARSQRSWER
jgi:branched-chain amino acid transport system permease protein